MTNPINVWVLIFCLVQVYAVPINETESWTGNWFPQNPHEVHTQKKELNELFDVHKTETNTKESWNGKWFPSVPDARTITSYERNLVASGGIDCDDGKRKISIDFDPNDKRESFNYLCLDHKSKYEPSFATSPIQREHVIPPAYRAPSKCLNETIEYDERLPTFGAHRHLYAKYGEYKFLPVQRWMHNLEYGAIIMLYHPCAYQMQVDKLRKTLNSCLYRHIITPSLLLLPERPLALVAWGKSLEMSVVDVSTVVDFIKQNAKKGPQTTQHDIQEYSAGLLTEAKLVTDESDSEVCANIIM